MKYIRNLILTCLILFGMTSCVYHQDEDMKKYVITEVELLDTTTENIQRISVFPPERTKMYIYEIRLSDGHQDTVINLKTRVGYMSNYIGDTVTICNGEIYKH